MLTSKGQEEVGQGGRGEEAGTEVGRAAGEHDARGGSPCRRKTEIDRSHTLNAYS